MDLTDRILRLLVALAFGWLPVVIALLAVGALAAARRTARLPKGARRLGLWGGLALLAVWGLANVLVYFGEPWRAAWWVQTAPVIVAAGAAAALLVRAYRAPQRPEVPVSPVARRGWLSFTRRRDAIVGGVVLAALLVTILVAGAASAIGPDGTYSAIEIPVGDQGPGYATFFGWAYGVPLLAALAVLVGAMVWALHVDAARPFLRPDTVEAETGTRRAASRAVFALAISAALLALGSALDVIANAGLGSVGVGIPGVGTFNYSTGYAALAPAMLWLGRALTLAAMVLLALTITGRRVIAERRS
jgi:hypothetical protein